MHPLDPIMYPWHCFVGFRDDPSLTEEENIAAYWVLHDQHFALCKAELADLKAEGHFMPEPPQGLLDSLMQMMPPLPGREAEYREWVGYTQGRGALAWYEARKKWRRPT